MVFEGLNINVWHFETNGVYRVWPLMFLHVFRLIISTLFSFSQHSNAFQFRMISFCSHFFLETAVDESLWKKTSYRSYFNFWWKLYLINLIRMEWQYNLLILLYHNRVVTSKVLEVVSLFLIPSVNELKH